MENQIKTPEFFSKTNQELIKAHLLNELIEKCLTQDEGIIGKYKLFETEIRFVEDNDGGLLLLGKGLQSKLS